MQPKSNSPDLRQWFARQTGNIALLVASSVITILMAEAGTRLLYTVPTREIDFFSLRKSSYYRKDDRMRWLPQKNVNGKHDQPGSFATSFRTNSRGLRDKEYPLRKPIDRRRIVALGDSFTWGWGLNDDEIYTEILEALLDRTDVINLGVTGFNTRQEFDYLKAEGMLYGPDLVILAFCMNDFAEGSIPNAKSNPVPAKPPLAQDNSLFLSAKAFLQYHSTLYNFVTDLINTEKRLINFLAQIGLKGPLGGYQALDRSLRPALKSYPEPLERQWESVTSALLEIQSFLLARNVRFIVALVPAKQWIEAKAFDDSIANTSYDPEHFDLSKPYKSLEEFGRRHHIEVINPLAAFRRNGSNVRLFLNRDMHFNKAGHELFGRVIAEYIRHTEKAS